MHKDNALLQNITKLHTTPLGIDRIKKNLSLKTEDVVGWCQTQICSDEAIIEIKGKNWYVYVTDCFFTINATSYTIITAHKKVFEKDSC